MAQVKIYALKSTISRYRELLSTAIHQALVDELGLPEAKKFQRFIVLEKESFIYPADRSDDYVIIEVLMFSGRSDAAKKAFINAIFSNIHIQCGIAPQDVEITLIESAKENWGIRGRPADELSLDYSINI